MQCAQWIPSALKHLFAVVSSLWRRRLRPPLLVVAIKSAMVGSWSSTDGPWSSTDGRWRVPLVKLSTDDREPASVHTTRAICGWPEVVCLRMAGEVVCGWPGSCLRMAGEVVCGLPGVLRGWRLAVPDGQRRKVVASGVSAGWGRPFGRLLDPSVSVDYRRR